MLLLLLQSLLLLLLFTEEFVERSKLLQCGVWECRLAARCSSSSSSSSSSRLFCLPPSIMRSLEGPF